MDIEYGNGKTKYGPGIQIDLTGEEVARAICTYLAAHNVHITGARTITINGKLIDYGGIYVDPSANVIANGKEYVGDGTNRANANRENAIIWWKHDLTKLDRIGIVNKFYEHRTPDSLTEREIEVIWKNK